MALGPVYEPNLLYSADFLDLQKNILQPFEKHSSILRKHSRRQGMQRLGGSVADDPSVIQSYTLERKMQALVPWAENIF